jgi:O-antigen/teichoic acid export membrane protein
LKTHIINAAYGVLDYAAYPIGMLLVAPIVLRNLGTQEYGVWAVATAAVSMGSIIASGFGDANIQHVASQRGLGRRDALLRAVRSMVGINLFLGTTLALIAWMLAPYGARHLAASDPVMQMECLWSLRIASVLMWIRAQESVCISTQRAFERYGAAVRISILVRLLSLAAAATLACFGQHVTKILLATAVLNVIGTGLQFLRLRDLLHAKSLAPAFDRDAMRALLAFGAFSWLQAVSSVIFSQADRLLLGVSLGATAVASYALCAQMAQPLYGFAASGLHFLFPYLASRSPTQSAVDLRKAVLLAFAVNVLFVLIAAAALLLCGQQLLHAWAGDTIALSAASIFPVIVWSAALLGLNVTGTYALFALGRVQIVTWIHLAGGAAMLLLMVCLLPRFGAYGLAIARLCYGSITLLLYLPLAHQLGKAPQRRDLTSATAPACEEA